MVPTRGMRAQASAGTDTFILPGPTTSEWGEINTVRSVNGSELKRGEKVWCHFRFSKDWKVLDCPAAGVRRVRRIFRIMNAQSIGER